jgi:cytochrome c oxidase subunit 1
MYNETWAQVHFFLFIGANLTLPMHWLGFAGMPRRIPDYPTAFAGWNFVCSYGAYVSVVSLIVFFIVVAEAFIVARPAPRNPWPDLGQTTAVYSLEWLLTSPMDFHTHSELPVIRIPTKKSVANKSIGLI